MPATWKKLAFEDDVVKHSLATAANDFLVASGSGVFVKKTLAETQTILGVDKIVQIVNYQTGAFISTALTIPADDTIPQQTEGYEFFTLAITPKSATNLLKIDVVMQIGCASPDNAIVALFQDSGANAIACGWTHCYTGDIEQVIFSYYMISNTTSPTTFKVRGGSQGGGVIGIGGYGSRIFGGVLYSGITITELKG